MNFTPRIAVTALGVERYQGVGYVDMVEIQSNPSTCGQIMVVARTYDQVASRITSARQLPAWQQFAHARQGCE